MTTPEHFEVVEEKLGKLLVALTSFSETENGEIRDFIDAGEYGLAAETGFQIVVEEDKRISQHAYDLFSQLVEAMAIQESVDLEQLAKHVQ